MAQMNEKELSDVLEKVLKAMEKILPPGTDKKKIIENVVDHLKKNDIKLDSNDFDFTRNPEHARNMTKALIIAVTTEATAINQDRISDPHYNPAMKFKYENLFKKQDNMLEMEKELKKELKNMLVMMNKPKPGDHKKMDELDELAEKLAKDLTNKFKKSKDQSRASENKDAVDVAMELTVSLASLYGGIDPRVAGGIVKPVQAVMGNFTGQVDFSQPGGVSYMSEQNTAEPGKADYTGKESITLTNAVSAGGGMLAEIEQALSPSANVASEYKSPTPFNTTPSPFNEK